MGRPLRCVLELGLASVLMALAGAAGAGEGGAKEVRLVVVVSMDQMRADYLPRFAGHFLPARGSEGVGGFAFLAGGATYADAHVGHIPTLTGPGHATLLTGSAPCLDGIVGNSWWERGEGRVRNCVADPTVRPVGGEARPASPRSLLVSTVGDELKLATGSAAKVVAISFKDRPAILMGGRRADLAVWLDEDTGQWVTSSYYRPDGTLPAWVVEENARHAVDGFAGRSWEPLLPPEAYRFVLGPASSGRGGVAVFSHPLGGRPAPDKEFREAFASSGLANELMAEMARRAVNAEGLGQDLVPDLLLLSFSTSDYVGHDFGPYSPEVMDNMVRADRALAGLFRELGRIVPGGLDSVVLVLTADHGVAAVPDQAAGADRAVPGRVRLATVADTVETALDAAFGPGDWVVSFTRTEPNMYLNQALVAERKLDPAVVERTAARAAMAVPGVYWAVTRTQLLTGQLPRTEWAGQATLGFHPQRSGDVVVLLQPGSQAAAEGTTHGTAWGYDSHVPLALRGPGIEGGRYLRRVTTMDLAPTLAELLGVESPNGCLGHPLFEALEGD